MRIPEIYALIRKLQGSNPEDRETQKIHRDMALELQGFVHSQHIENALPFADAATALLAGLAGPAPLVDRPEVLRVASRLLLLAGYALAAQPTQTSPAPRVMRPTPTRAPANQAPERSPTQGPREPAKLAEPPPGHPELASINRMVLGRILVELGHLDEAALERALLFQREKGLPLGECMLLLDLTDPKSILEALRLQERMHTASNEEEATAALAQEQTPASPPRPAAQAPGTSEGSRHFQVGPQIFLGEVLLAARKITGAQLEDAMHRHHHEGVRVGEALVALGAMTQADLQVGLALQQRLREIAGWEPVEA